MTTDPAPGAHRSTRFLLGRLLKNHVRPHFGRLALAVLCMLITAGSTAALAHLMEPVLDDVFINRDEGMLVLIPLVVLLVTLLKGAATYGESVLMGLVGQRIIADFQQSLFAHLIRLDLAFFHQSGTGRLISRLTNDVNLMRNTVSSVLTSLAKDSLTLIFLVGVMFEKDWRLALIGAVALPLAVYPIARVGRRMRKITRGQLAHVGHYTARLAEAFSGVRHIKADNREAHESQRTDSAVESIYRIVVKAYRTRALIGPIMETLGGLAVAAIIFYGGHQVIEGTTTPGQFFAFVTALLLAYKPLKSLANLNTHLQEGMAASQRVFDLLDAEPQIRERAGAHALALRRGSIRFEHVDFAYGGDAPALHDISFEIPAGRRVALVGPSGAGKTTILNLIPRFYDAKAGTISIDGEDVRAVTLNSLRNAVALVSQEPFLFDDSVRANIAYSRPDADDAAIVAAAKAAAAHDFILALPQGYDTVLGERGVRLSGGQRQRIAIARAMLKDAPILLLDEATSELDSESERHVQEALARLMEGRTTLVIAHRLASVIGADRIHVVENGRITDSGTHAELLARGGTYARLYRLQFTHDDGVSPQAAPGRA